MASAVAIEELAIRCIAMARLFNPAALKFLNAHLLGLSICAPLPASAVAIAMLPRVSARFPVTAVLGFPVVTDLIVVARELNVALPKVMANVLVPSPDAVKVLVLSLAMLVLASAIAVILRYLLPVEVC